MAAIKAPSRPDLMENGSSKTPLTIQFPHNDRSYKCICGLVHVKFATTAIGGISMVGFFMSFFWRVITYFGTNASLGPTIISAIPLFIASAATIALFIGLIRQQCKFLLLFIFVQITAVLASTVFLVMVVIFVACDTRYVTDALIGEELQDSQNHSLAKLLLISIMVIQLLLNVWATRVVCTCYRYFDEFEVFQKYYPCV